MFHVALTLHSTFPHVSWKHIRLSATVGSGNPAGNKYVVRESAYAKMSYKHIYIYIYINLY